MDVSDDLGNPLPPTETVAVASTNHNVSNTSSATSKSASIGYVQSSRSPMRVRPSATSAYVSTGSSFPGSGTVFAIFAFMTTRNNHVDLTK